MIALFSLKVKALFRIFKKVGDGSKSTLFDTKAYQDWFQIFTLKICYDNARSHIAGKVNFNGESDMIL